MLYRIDSYRHMYILLFRICFRYVPILVSFLWISNSSNLLIWIELYVIAWIPYVPLLSIPFKSEYTCERLLLTSDWLVKAHVSFVVPRVLPIYATYCWNCPFVLWCVGLSGPLPEMVKGMRWFARFVGSRFVGYSGMRLFARFVGSRFVGYCLEPAMLCRPPLTSPRRGWMELPDVGDFCQVVIQKWMNHILTEIPLHPLYVWYDIQSFGELFLFVLWIVMIWLQRQGRRLSFCTTYEFDMLWNASFTVDFAS